MIRKCAGRASNAGQLHSSQGSISFLQRRHPLLSPSLRSVEIPTQHFLMRTSKVTPIPPLPFASNLTHVKYSPRLLSATNGGAKRDVHAPSGHRRAAAL